MDQEKKKLRLVELPDIKKAVADRREVMEAVKEGFIAYSLGKAQIPPVGYLGFQNPDGDVHIKYGSIGGGEHYVVKIASGFYGNAKLGLPSSTGIVLVFSAKTGFVDAILADDGYLTAARTAAAGAVVAQALAPAHVEGIGIIGTGDQARLQLSWLAQMTACRQVYLYGRSREKAARCRDDMEGYGFSVILCDTPREVAAHANLIVTTTCAKEPLLFAGDIRPGTHITAMGTDAPGKNEIAADVFAKADVIVADSRSQCVDHGDISYAVRRGILAESRVVELGEVLSGSKPGRTDEGDITVADLTGVAVQDIAIAEVALRHLTVTEAP